MAEHVWSILCESSIVDTQTNRISVLNAVEGIGVFATKAQLDEELERAEAEGGALVIPVNFQLASFWVRSEPEQPEEVMLRLVIDTPDGRSLSNIEVPVNLSNHAATRLRLVINTMPYTGDGLYWVSVAQAVDENEGGQTKLKRIARLPLMVQRQDPPTLDRE